MRSALDFFPGYMTAGGGIALAGASRVDDCLLSHESSLRIATHFQFLKEIPIFAPYEIRMSLVAWDQKWVGDIPVLYARKDVLIISTGLPHRSICHPPCQEAEEKPAD